MSRRKGMISAAVLLLLLGTAAPSYSQDDSQRQDDCDDRVGMIRSQSRKRGQHRDRPHHRPRREAVAASLARGKKA